jgi:hypothetical protein
MRKLKLDSLHVESFATAAAAPRPGGTVQGHAGPVTFDFRCRTVDVTVCPDTQYLDCTLGCSNVASCIAC